MMSPVVESVESSGCWDLEANLTNANADGQRMQAAHSRSVLKVVVFRRWLVSGKRTMLDNFHMRHVFVCPSFRCGSCVAEEAPPPNCSGEGRRACWFPLGCAGDPTAKTTGE